MAGKPAIRAGSGLIPAAFQATLATWILGALGVGS